MKVRCIRNEHHEHNLTIGKDYDVHYVGHETFDVVNDNGDLQQHKSYRFKIVDTKQLLLECKCIDNIGYEEKLTNGKTYTVIAYGKSTIIVCDDNNEYSTFTNGRFENIPAQPAKLGLDVLEIPNGIKHDSGKLKPTLLLDDMPLAIQEVLKVLKFGAEKYSEGNWLKVNNGIKRYRNAADRHRLQSSINEIDDESGLLHLAHEATSILMLLELKLRNGK